MCLLSSSLSFFNHFAFLRIYQFSLSPLVISFSFPLSPLLDMIPLLSVHPFQLDFHHYSFICFSFILEALSLCPTQSNLFYFNLSEVCLPLVRSYLCGFKFWYSRITDSKVSDHSIAYTFRCKIHEIHQFLSLYPCP